MIEKQELEIICCILRIKEVIFKKTDDGFFPKTRLNNFNMDYNNYKCLKKIKAKINLLKNKYRLYLKYHNNLLNKYKITIILYNDYL
jgi:hypothetical protein